MSSKNKQIKTKILTWKLIRMRCKINNKKALKQNKQKINRLINKYNHKMR